MGTRCSLPAFPFMLLQLILSGADGFSIGGGIAVGIGTGGGGGAAWIGGGTNGASPLSKMDNAYIPLQAWKSAIRDDPHGILRDWEGPDVCSYKGVFCSTDAEGGSVVSGIDLNHADLEGTLVSELGLLTDISLLHLNSNRFSGTIPDTFRDLSSLQELDLSNNQFSGPFPMITLYIPNLIYLDIRFNCFSGAIPQNLFNKKLDAIFLNDNQFDGQLPENLGNSPASVINLANNKFTGSIPFSFGFMGSKIKEILFLNNQLTGCIPEGVGIFTDMQVFDVSSNDLAGHLPDTISCLTDIEVLNLAHNRLSGELPAPLCSLRSLVNLTVAYNFFSGFSEQCSSSFFKNIGFDFSLNCIPGGNMQRPRPECSMIPGGSLSCFRMPSRPLLCGAMLAESAKTPSP